MNPNPKGEQKIIVSRETYLRLYHLKMDHLQFNKNKTNSLILKN